MLVFLSCEPARQLAIIAQEQWQRGENRDAMESLRLAFDELTLDYTKRKQWYPGKGLFTTKPTFYPSTIDLKQAGLEKIDEWLGNLDKWVRHVALGIDMRQFAYFDAHAPTIHYTMNGKHHARFRDEAPLTDEVFTRCFKFVVDVGLGLAKDDFDFDLWAAPQAARSGETKGGE